MIVGGSALLAVILEEPDAGTMTSAIATALSRRTSAASWLEAAMVVDGRGDRSPLPGSTS